MYCPIAPSLAEVGIHQRFVWCRYIWQNLVFMEGNMKFNTQNEE